VSTTTFRITFTGGIPSAVVIADQTAAFGIRRTDTNAVLVAAGTAADNPSAGVYEYTIIDPAAGVPYEAWFKLTVGSDTVYRQQIKASVGLDGYYVKHAKVLRYAGALNLAAYSNLDASSPAAIDPDVLQAYYDEVDRFVDFLARYVYGWTLAPGETHLVPTTDPRFAVLSDAASQYAIPQVYGARGLLDTLTDADKGKMENKERESEAMIREVLGSGLRVGSADLAAPADASPTNAAYCELAYSRLYAPWGL
jgi:hypothetical protein